MPSLNKEKKNTEVVVQESTLVWSLEDPGKNL